MKHNRTRVSLALGCLLTLLSACKSSPSTTLAEKETLLESIPIGVAAMYDPVPIECSISDEYKRRVEHFLNEDVSNTVHKIIFGQDVEFAELSLSNGQVFAVYFACSYHKNPIPDVELSDVEKIIYGYSTEEGLVVEDPEYLQSIITCLKTRTLQPREEAKIILPVEGETFLRPSITRTVSLHGCTMAIRIILKNGDVVITGGHVQDREWNPALAGVFANIVEDDKYMILGGRSIEELLYVEDN